MAISQGEARALAAGYGAMARQRDKIITECKAADLGVSEIARLMAVSRKCVYEVLGRAAREAARNSSIPACPGAPLAEIRRRLAAEGWPQAAGADPMPVFLPPPPAPLDY